MLLPQTEWYTVATRAGGSESQQGVNLNCCHGPPRPREAQQRQAAAEQYMLMSVDLPAPGREPRLWQATDQTQS